MHNAETAVNEHLALR